MMVTVSVVQDADQSYGEWGYGVTIGTLKLICGTLEKNAIFPPTIVWSNESFTAFWNA